MRHVNACGVVHGDIRGENYLLMPHTEAPGGGWHAMPIDLGFSYFLNENEISDASDAQMRQCSEK